MTSGANRHDADDLELLGKWSQMPTGLNTRSRLRRLLASMRQHSGGPTELASILLGGAALGATANVLGAAGRFDAFWVGVAGCSSLAALAALGRRVRSARRGAEEQRPGPLQYLLIPSAGVVAALVLIIHFVQERREASGHFVGTRLMLHTVAVEHWPL
jgi:hypothetical protein